MGKQVSGDYDNARAGLPTGRVVVVIGRPDQALVASLLGVGLTPVAEDGDEVVWGSPTRSNQRRAGKPVRDGDTSCLLMTIADAGSALGLGRSAICELIGRGDLEVVNLGRSSRIPVGAVHEFVERRRVADGGGHTSEVGS